MVKKFELKKFEFKKNLKKKNLKKKIFFLVRTYVKPNLVFSKIPFTLGGGGGGVQKSKLIRMAWNMVSFWNFWDPMKFSEIWSEKLTGQQASKQASKEASKVAYIRTP